MIRLNYFPIPIRQAVAFRSVMLLYEQYVLKIAERKKMVKEEAGLCVLEDSNGKLLTKYAQMKVQKTLADLNNLGYEYLSDCEIRVFGREKKVYTIDWVNKTCTCGYFQDMKLPCVHAMAIWENRSELMNEKILEYSDKHFLVNTVLNTCNVDVYNATLDPSISYKINIEDYIVHSLTNQKVQVLRSDETPGFIKDLVDKCERDIGKDFDKKESAVVKGKVRELLKSMKIDGMETMKNCGMKRRLMSSEERSKRIAAKEMSKRSRLTEVKY